MRRIIVPGAVILFPANAAAAAMATTVAHASVTTSGFTITGSALANAAYYYMVL